MKAFAISLLALLMLAVAFWALLTPAFSTVETVERRTEEKAAGSLDTEPPAPSAEEEAGELERRVSDLEGQADDDQADPNFPTEPVAGAGSMSLLAGIFCAALARNTGRNARLWFFLGLFFNIFAVVALLGAKKSDNTAAA